MSTEKNGVILGLIVALVIMVYFDGNAIAFFKTGENSKGILYIALNILSIPLGILGSMIANRLRFLRIFLQIVFSIFLVVSLNFFLDKMLAPPDLDDVIESNISGQYVPAEQASQAEPVQPEAAQATAQPPAQTTQPAQAAQNTIPYKTEGELVFFMNDGKLNVRESPDRSAKVVFQLDRPTAVSTLELTARKDTIDGVTDRWVKIKMEDGRTGWVFGGFLGTETSGPKYNTEEDIKEWKEMVGDDEGI